MAIEDVKASGTTWTIEDLHNGKVIGGVYYSNDRGNMPGGTVDASYCWRVKSNQCVDLGFGVFGTKGKGPYQDNEYFGAHENTLVPNLHFGTSWMIDPTLTLGLLGRVGIASMRGNAGYPDYAGYRKPGVYVEGVFRLLGNTGHHKIFGSAVFLDGGVASFPEGGEFERGAGFLIRSGFIATFGRPKPTK